jgi:hypothetical protein
MKRNTRKLRLELRTETVKKLRPLPLSELRDAKVVGASGDNCPPTSCPSTHSQTH